MNPWQKKCWLAVVGVVLCAVCAWAAVRICPKCGYENGTTRLLCVHCGEALPELPPPDEVDRAGASEADGEGGFEFLDSQVVEDEIAAGIDAYRKGDPEVAALFLQNASALEMLTDGEQGHARAKRILQLLGRAEEAEKGFRRTCPVCRGSGRGTMTVTSTKGEETTREVYGKSCPGCNGVGFVQGVGTVNERKFRKGQALGRYTRLQQGRKRAPVGGAWVPLTLETRLSVRQSVILRRASAAPCPECLGIGRQQCGHCVGTGRVKCSNRSCVNGQVEVVRRGELSSMVIKRNEECKVCRGRGTLECPRCKGRGSFLCEKCDGSGARALCPKCGGQGMQPCGRCGGSGRVGDGPCPVCRGERVVVCSTCRGDGRTP